MTKVAMDLYVQSQLNSQAVLCLLDPSSKKHRSIKLILRSYFYYLSFDTFAALRVMKMHFIARESVKFTAFHIYVRCGAHSQFYIYYKVMCVVS
jgi:hypothetical protein